MSLYRIYMVVSVGDLSAEDADHVLEGAAGAFEDYLFDRGFAVRFYAAREGYAGEMADLGADPTSWPREKDEHGDA